MTQSAWSVSMQVASGRLFGITNLLKQAATEFAGVKGDADVPTVAVVGEIYVRLREGEGKSRRREIDWLPNNVKRAHVSEALSAIRKSLREQRRDMTLL